ncbi:MAG: hypothetical protein LBR90_04615 [Elusimicrobiota bacterium]|jgi:hypothetical protein|nr:hypothetical protein [Elusimicrobiota bacterium]
MNKSKTTAFVTCLCFLLNLCALPARAFEGFLNPQDNSAQNAELSQKLEAVKEQNTPAAPGAGVCVLPAQPDQSEAGAGGVMHYFITKCGAGEIEKLQQDAEALAAFYQIAAGGLYSAAQTQDITLSLLYYLKNNHAPRSISALAGGFLQNPQFVELRQRVLSTIQVNYRSVDFISPFISALSYAGSLSVFGEDKQKLQDILNASLKRQAGILGIAFSPGNSTDNESVSMRVFMDATSFFASREGDSFWKGFLTNTFDAQRLGLKFAVPGRGGKGDFLDNESGRAHKMAFDIIDILVADWVLSGQMQQIEDFITNQSIRRGPYYFQFAVDAMALATYYYARLGDEALAQTWQTRQEELVKKIRSNAKWELSLLSTAGLVSQTAFEWSVFALAGAATGKYIISPVAKGVFALLPTSFQMKFFANMAYGQIVFRLASRKFLGKTQNALLYVRNAYAKAASGALAKTAPAAGRSYAQEAIAALRPAMAKHADDIIKAYSLPKNYVYGYYEKNFALRTGAPGFYQAGADGLLNRGMIIDIADLEAVLREGIKVDKTLWHSGAGRPAVYFSSSEREAVSYIFQNPPPTANSVGVLIKVKPNAKYLNTRPATNIHGTEYRSFVDVAPQDIVSVSLWGEFGPVDLLEVLKKAQAGALPQNSAWKSALDDFGNVWK